MTARSNNNKSLNCWKKHRGGGEDELADEEEEEAWANDGTGDGDDGTGSE